LVAHVDWTANLFNQTPPEGLMDSSRRITIGKLCWAVAVIAIALGIPRLYPTIWRLLNAPQIGSIWGAGLIYAWFWIGILLATTLRSTKTGRLYDCAWVTLSVIPLVLLSSHLHVATTPDFSFLAPTLVIMAILCFLGGFIASRKDAAKQVRH
jgi:hypothetical protein